jgi:hypothetical protein
MILKLAVLLSHPIFAETNAERRGRLLGYFLASVVILVIGVVLVIKNRKKK